MLIRKCIRIPREIDQFIQNKADKQALLDGKKSNWTKALINYIKTKSKNNNLVDTSGTAVNTWPDVVRAAQVLKDSSIFKEE